MFEREGMGTACGDIYRFRECESAGQYGGEKSLLSGAGEETSGGEGCRERGCLVNASSALWPTGAQ